MDYEEIDQEFRDLVEMAFECDSRVEIIYGALKAMGEYYPTSPKLALEIGIRDFDN